MGNVRVRGMVQVNIVPDGGQFSIMQMDVWLQFNDVLVVCTSKGETLQLNDMLVIAGDKRDGWV